MIHPKRSLKAALLALLTAMLTLPLATAGGAPSARVDFNRDWTFVKSKCEWVDDFTAEAKAMAPVILPHENCAPN